MSNWSWDTVYTILLSSGMSEMGMQRFGWNDAVRSLVLKLIHKSFPGGALKSARGTENSNPQSTTGSALNPSQEAKVYDYVMRHFNSTMESVLPSNEDELFQALKRLLANEPTKLAALTANLSRLQAAHSPLKSVVPILQLLHALRSSSSQLTKSSASFSVLGWFDPPPAPAVQSGSARRLTTPKTAPSPVAIPLPSLPPSTPVLATPPPSKGHSWASALPESSLVRDAVYALQGNASPSIVAFDADAEYRAVLATNIALSIPHTAALRRIGAAGSAYLYLSNFVSSASSSSTGTVQQAFAAALTKELAEYSRLVSVMDAQVAKGRVSLRKLCVWLETPMAQLKLLTSLAKASQGLSGGALAAALVAFKDHGDTSVVGYVNKLLTDVTEPIFRSLYKWVYEGELVDPHKETFISVTPNVEPGKMWTDKYHLKTEALPGFLEVADAERILTIGKSLLFLRTACADPMTARSLLKRPEDPHEAGWTYGRPAALSATLRDAEEKVGKTVLKTLMGRYRLQEHAAALKRYLLLEAGDFVHALLTGMALELSKPSEAIFSHNLTAILKSAISSSSAGEDDPEFTGRLDVKLFSAPGAVGWDVVSLDYSLTPPLSTVLTPSVVQAHLKLFTFLWRLKRVEDALNGVWKVQATSRRALWRVISADMARQLSAAYAVRTEMVHFVTQLQYYMSYEVRDSAWVSLKAALRSAAGLDDLIAAMSTYAADSVSKALLGPDSVALRAQLETMFGLILRFADGQNRLWAALAEEAAGVAAAQATAALRGASGEWGLTDADDSAFAARTAGSGLVIRGLDGSYTLSSAAVAEVADVSAAFTQAFTKFRAQAAASGLRYLTFRLDFNEHYARQGL